MNKLTQWLQNGSPVSRWWQSAVTFIAEVKSEMKRVSFPSRDEVVATTIVVIITSFLFAFYLWLADIAIIKTYEATLRVFGS